MFSEYADVRQIPGEPRRRWFSDREFELIVWLEPDGAPHGFQLCYLEGTDQKTVTWKPESGYAHNTIDAGEDSPGRHKMTPILVVDGIFPRDRVLALFETRSDGLDPLIRRFVAAKLRDFR